MYHYIFPLPSEEIPSNQYYKPIKKAPYDIVAISCGREAYADVVPSITVTKTVYCEGASESEENGLRPPCETVPPKAVYRTLRLGGLP